MSKPTKYPTVYAIADADFINTVTDEPYKNLQDAINEACSAVDDGGDEMVVWQCKPVRLISPGEVTVQVIKST